MARTKLYLNLNDEEKLKVKIVADIEKKTVTGLTRTVMMEYINNKYPDINDIVGKILKVSDESK